VHFDETKGFAMTSAGRTELTTEQLDALALGFLRSEFADKSYSGWPIDRCVDAYLHHRGLDDLLNDGGACDELLERVMANIGRALRPGLVESQQN
jgi:hypothetical protein